MVAFGAVVAKTFLYLLSGIKPKDFMGGMEGVEREREKGLEGGWMDG